jgi:heat shock protein HslJ
MGSLSLRRSIALLLLLGSPAIAEESALGLWRIDQAQREPIYDRTQARLDFGAEGRLTGHTGCKPMIATYTLESGRLRVGPVRTGTARCNAQQLEQEDRILTALEAAASLRVRDDGLLELRDPEGRGVLRGTRFEPKQP